MAAACWAHAGGAPEAAGVAGDDAAKLAAVKRFAPVFTALGAGAIDKGWGGADISPLTEAGVLSLSLRPEGSRYFDVHHSPADTVEKIDPGHLQANAAAFALMAYILAERSPAWLNPFDLRFGIGVLHLAAVAIFAALALARRDRLRIAFLLPFAISFSLHALGTEFLPRYAVPLLPCAWVAVAVLVLGERRVESGPHPRRVDGLSG